MQVPHPLAEPCPHLMGLLRANVLQTRISIPNLGGSDLISSRPCACHALMPSSTLCADHRVVGIAVEGPVHLVTHDKQHALRGRRRTGSNWGVPQVMSKRFRFICNLTLPAFGPVATCVPEGQTDQELLLRQQWIALQAPGRTGRGLLTTFAVSTSRTEAPSNAQELSPEDDWEDSAPAWEAAASELTGEELFSRQHVGRWTPAMAAYFPFGGLQ